MKKLSKLAVLIMGMALAFVFASCKGEVITEYVTKEVEKNYASAVTFTVTGTATEGTISVKMQSATEDAVIYYTSDGSTPTAESSKYTSALTVSADTVFRAIAVKEGIENSPISVAAVYIKEKTVTQYVEQTEDSTAPAPAVDLKATPKDSRVLLTWSDAADEDIFGYEVSYSGSEAINRAALSPIAKNSMIVPNGAGGCYICGLTNGTAYTFTVKTMDTSGNKSTAITATATPVAVSVAETMKIALTATVPNKNILGQDYSGNKSNTKVTVTVNITTASNVKKVVWKKNGSLIAKTLLADTEATAATVSDDNAVWTFDITATDETSNGTYTVAAIDDAGREEVELIEIDNFDFTPPARVKVTYDNYDKNSSEILLTWTEPKDEDYHHVGITFTSNDGTNDSVASDAVNITKGSTHTTFSDIDGDKAYYTYTFTTYDEVGNAGEKRIHKVSVKTTVKNLPEGFVEVIGGTVSSSVENSRVFNEGKTFTIQDMYVCDHEVTQKEYETYCKYGGNSSPSDTYGKGDNHPVYYVSWLDAIIYCNLRSIEEDLIPVYSFYDETDPRKSIWLYYLTKGDVESKYCGTDSTGGNIIDMITFDTTANGYRLPTEAEWEYIARGGNYGIIPSEQTIYAGSDDLDTVAWYDSNSENKTHEVKGKQPNALGVYDMSGNVFERCYDTENNYNKVYRGGSFDGYNYYCKLSNKMNPCPYGYGALDRKTNTGFRVVRNIK